MLLVEKDASRAEGGLDGAVVVARLDFCQTRGEDGVEREPMGGDVIGVAVNRRRDEHGARAKAPQMVDDSAAVLGRVRQIAVGQADVGPLVQPENPACLDGFKPPLGDRATGAEFAFGQVEHADPATGGDGGGQRPAAEGFGIVGVRGDCQQVERFQRGNGGFVGRRKRLVLFDIDGTLVRTKGVARAIIPALLREIYNVELDVSAADFAGKTDPQILGELLALAGYQANGHAAELADRFFARYVERMRPALTAERITVLPGVRPLLDRLAAAPDTTLALLTGNLADCARFKLEPVGLAEYFAFGAYGSDAPARRDLPAIALDRAEHHTGHRHVGPEVVIIGDTIHDVSCGRHLGVRSVAVATGGTSLDALRESDPTHLFADLTDTDRVARAILD